MNENVRKGYTIPECIFAWFCFFAAYVFCQFFPASRAPLGSFLLVLVLFIFTTVISLIRGGKLSPLPILTAVSAIIISASLILCSNEFVYFFAYSYVIVAYCYYIFALNGNVTKNGFNDFIIADYIKALFILPFCSFVSLFKGMFSGSFAQKAKVFLKVLLGIAIAIVPTAIVIYLLSYDKNFMSILNKVFYFDFTFADVVNSISRLFLSLPTAMYIYGLFISSAYNKCSAVLNENTCKSISENVKIIPATTSLTAVIPLLLVYIVFFISQWNYYISGFTGVLPEEFSYAQYAREGFFQLCIVSVINLIIIVAVMIFMKQKDIFSTMLLKIISVTYSIITLVLISTALSKMFMYIDYYGLTQKRVYATWLMAVIAIIFILIIIRQFVPSFKLVISSCAVCVVMFAALSVVNMDALIARYNVNCYINGKFNKMDIESLMDIGDSAIPALVDLFEELDNRIENTAASTYDKTLSRQLMNKLENLASKYDGSNKTFYSYTIPYIQAQKALKSIDLIK